MSSQFRSHGDSEKKKKNTENNTNKDKCFDILKIVSLCRSKDVQGSKRWGTKIDC